MAFEISRERRWRRGRSHCCRWEHARNLVGVEVMGGVPPWGWRIWRLDRASPSWDISSWPHVGKATCSWVLCPPPPVLQGFWGRMICPLLSGGSSPCPWVLPGDCLTHCLLILFNHRRHCVMDPRHSPDFRLRNQTLPRDLCEQHFFPEGLGKMQIT